MTITLQDVALDDREFLREVYASTRAEEMAMVPWSQEQQRAFLDFQFNAQDVFYHERFPHAQYSIILQDGEPIGRLYILREDKEIRMIDITVLPQYRGRGIGSFLIRGLLDEGKRTGRVVQIFVESFNRSRSLFERFGFSVVREEGINLLFAWQPENNSGVHTRTEPA
jgi:ribosomal protein S18 acetylase RimI-like enzyme